MDTDLTIWEYNSLQLELDMRDVDTMKRYHEAFAKMGASEKSIPKDGETYEIMDAYVGLFYTLFDDIFGAGTAEKLFDGKRSGTKCDLAYESFLDFVEKQNAGAQDRLARMTQRYSTNRAQRRAKK